MRKVAEESVAKTFWDHGLADGGLFWIAGANFTYVHHAQLLNRG